MSSLCGSREIDPGVSEAVASIIHAAPRQAPFSSLYLSNSVLTLESLYSTELKELHILREMLMSKAGRDYAIAAIDNTDSLVPERVRLPYSLLTIKQRLVADDTQKRDGYIDYFEIEN